MAYRAKWLQENEPHLWKSAFTSRKAVGHAEWPWIKKQVAVSELHIQTIAWGPDGQQRRELFQTFGADDVTVAKDYARQLIETGEAKSVKIEGRWSPQWGHEQLAYTFGEMQRIEAGGLTEHEASSLEAAAMPGGYRGFGSESELRSLQRAGLVQPDGERWIATDRGRDLLAQIKSRFGANMHGGRAEGLRARDFDPEQLAIGAEHELEHTDDPLLAQEIAMDHLAEDEAYYEKLNAMERQSFRNNSGYYVWVLDSHGVPMSREGVHGPYDLASGKTYARIAATKGKHDRAVSYGRDPQSPSFTIARRYKAGTGERVI